MPILEDSLNINKSFVGGMMNKTMAYSHTSWPNIFNNQDGEKVAGEDIIIIIIRK